MGAGRILGVALLLAWSASGALPAQEPAALDSAAALEPQAALAKSRAAIGRSLGDFSFVDQKGRLDSFARYRGRPVVVSVVFTACTQSCPLILQRLAEAVDVAREALGPESFSIVTLGLDPGVDTPDRLEAYARSQGAALEGWDFVSLEAGGVARLTEDLGFTYFPSPRGFDHITQISIIGSDGIVSSHVYGQDFPNSALVEPLKAAIFDDLAALQSLGQVIERIRLFCTFYDAKRDRYYFDYSFFIALIVGVVVLSGLGFVLARAWIRSGPASGTS
jgi:protein SCO1/2